MNPVGVDLNCDGLISGADVDLSREESGIPFHEIGHTSGGHGSGMGQRKRTFGSVNLGSNVGWAPHFLGVMNHRYQFGIPTGGGQSMLPCAPNCPNSGDMTSGEPANDPNDVNK